MLRRSAARALFRGEIVPVIAAEAALKHSKHRMPILSDYTYRFAAQVIEVPYETFNGFNKCARGVIIGLAHELPGTVLSLLIECLLR